MDDMMLSPRAIFVENSDGGEIGLTCCAECNKCLSAGCWLKKVPRFPIANDFHIGDDCANQDPENWCLFMIRSVMISW